MVGDGNAEVWRVHLAERFQMSADLVVSIGDLAPVGDVKRHEVAKKDSDEALYQSQPELDGSAAELLTKCREFRVGGAQQRIRIGEQQRRITKG